MVKKVWIFDNEGKASQETSKKLKELLLREPELTLDEKNPEIIISIGGDGTMLSAFQKYQEQTDKIQFVGVHTGHLGFYTDFLSTELNKLIQVLRAEKIEESVRYPLLSVKVHFENEDVLCYYALNEATVRRGIETLRAEVEISDFSFEKFRGDGLVVSTPTGSTAYNKSVGGAVIHPRVEAMQMAEIASINNRVFRTLGSAMIVAKKDNIIIYPEENQKIFITIDQNEFYMENIKKVTFSLDGKTIAFASRAHIPFWERVKNSFIGEG
ncbi:MAG: NAD kinase [Lactovum sp.]